jgi:hypothetical membrane protein
MGVERTRGRAGAVLWILNVQYYVVQIVAAAFWAKSHSYSWRHNTISDLANTHCGAYNGRLVCSPLHTIMNVSFVVLGATMIGGVILLQKQFATSRATAFGFGCMALAGAGIILVGLFPENTDRSFHITGAALSFTLGNLGMIVLGTSLKRLPALLRVYTILSGVLGLAALACFMTNTYAGLGIGGMERLVSYPQTIWMIVFGAYLSIASPKRPPKPYTGKQLFW